MERKLADLSELIVDTTFLLPFLGVKVRGIESDRLLEGRTVYYPSLMLVELLAVVFKEAKRLKLRKVPEEAIVGLSYLVSSLRFVNLEGQDVQVAYDVVSRGWNDVFDATLYSAHATTKVPVVTADRSFYDFLKRNGFDVDGVILV
ncbi:PIN domain-containing protein [Sulfodiicoccus acidiphilus]|uniref:PIN domain-containing protein n=1 Tax=Sulfodiicoccus acidiphilus TaxID=1670455 RepID=A0A348B594_9CREN|nr:PIN domain-containing protein [Sulfodiicoccus acidiphilus]BBD73346.1 PIN domain-containing protein [Sulfodiicoccus acidiphilus]GGT88939.1 PIN domain-containing protein [Sulfodiicoccus acidiphilus]